MPRNDEAKRRASHSAPFALLRSPWIALGIWTGLALAGGRIAVLLAMDLVAHRLAPSLVRARLIADSTGILLAASGLGLACALAAWGGASLRSKPWLRVLVIVPIGAVLFLLLAGWLGADLSRAVTTETSRGRAAAFVLAVASLVLATGLVWAAVRVRERIHLASFGFTLLPLFVLGLTLGGLYSLKREKTSVIFLVVDTLRADYVLDPELGAHTPHMDALIAEGIAFERAFAHTSLTLPSHATLFSSRYPHHTGVIRNGQSIASDLPLLPEWLWGHGYETRAVVSLGTLYYGGIERGFSRYDDDTTWLMREAPTTVDRLEDQLAGLGSGTPFFLFAHFSDPHEPYNAHGTKDTRAEISLAGEALAEVPTSDMSTWEEEVSLPPGTHRLEIRSDDDFLIKTFSVAASESVSWEFEAGSDKRTPLQHATILLENGADGAEVAKLSMWIHDRPRLGEIADRYRGEVEFLDRHLGVLIERLRELDLWDESLVIFTSDHGEALGEHGSVGHGRGVYEELIHVPLIVKPPASLALDDLHRLRQRLVRHVDVAPTVLEVLGLPPLPGQVGLSLLEDGSRLVVSESHAPDSPRDTYAVRDDEYKLVYYPDDDSFELYDMVRDPEELEAMAAADLEARPDWPDRLRAMAALAERTVDSDSDAEVDQEALQALGYAGD